MKIEQDTLAGLLYKPEMIARVEVETEWFFDTELRDIAEVLLLGGIEFADPNVLYEEMKYRKPHNTLNAEFLENLRISGYGVEIESNTKAMKKRYYKERFDLASRSYAKVSDEPNLNKLKDALREMEECEEVEDDGKLDGVFEDFMHQLETELSPGILTYPQLDSLLGGGIYGDNLITIGARPAVGKSAFALNLALQALQNQKGMMVDFFTLEMSKEQTMKRFISRMTDINSLKMRNPKLRLKDDEKAKVTSSGIQLVDSELRVYDKMFTIGQIERQIRRKHFEAKGKDYMVIIDYLGLVAANNTRVDRHLQVGEITRTLKMLSSTLKIPIILLSQLNRGIENRAEKKPVLSDLRESGSVEQDSSIVAFLHDDEELQQTVLSVAKNREGFTGEIYYKFFKSKMYFEEV